LVQAKGPPARGFEVPLFSDAERGKNRVEHIFNPDSAGDAAQRPHREPQFLAT
jgi:hypothetical protein